MGLDHSVHEAMAEMLPIIAFMVDTVPIDVGGYMEDYPLAKSAEQQLVVRAVLKGHLYRQKYALLDESAAKLRTTFQVCTAYGRLIKHPYAEKLEELANDSPPKTGTLSEEHLSWKMFWSALGKWVHEYLDTSSRPSQ